MTDCIVETTVPLRAFPTTIEKRETGATSISFINPNSLSHMIEIDEKMELKRMVIPIIPGKMNCVYGTPISLETIRDIPAPTMNNHRRGLATAEKSLLFSRKNFLISRATIT